MTGRQASLWPRLVRSLDGREKNQHTFYLCQAPEGGPPTMTYFATIAGRRWPVDSRLIEGAASQSRIGRRRDNCLLSHSGNSLEM